MVLTGFSAVIGSWNTMPMSSPRMPHSSASDFDRSSSPSSWIDPPLRAEFGSSCMIESAVIDLPDPDSPMTPSTSPASTREVDIAQNRGSADRQRQVLDLEQPHGRLRRSCGSKMSRNPSPMRLTPSTMSTMVEPGHDRGMRRERDHRLRIGQHLAPARVRRLRAEPDIGQRRLGEDAERELDGRLHDQRVDDVGQDVLERDAGRALSRRRAPRG